MEAYEALKIEILEAIAAEAVQLFEAAVTRKGLVLTGELRDSFRSTVIEQASSLTAVITFTDYGRFKDMKRLNYSTLPPVEVMQKYVEKVGVDKFAYAPGYHKMPTADLAVKRIAWGLAYSRLRNGVNRGITGSWYNETKVIVTRRAISRLANRTASLTVKTLKDKFEGL